MTRLLSIVASAASFAVAVRFVPGLDFSQARASPVGAIAVAALVAVVALFTPWAVGRVRRDPTPLLVGAFSVGVQALLLLVLGAIGTRVRLGLEVGGWPAAFGAQTIVTALLAALFLSVVPVAIVLAARRGLTTVPEASFTVPRGPSVPVLAIFFLSGAAGLIYEVVWARQLVLVFGNTTQAVSAILTGYFGGLAIGSVIGGRIADRVRSPLRLYGVIEILLVVIVLLTPILFRGLHELYRGWYEGLEQAPTALALLRYVLALLALAPATILMGATLPTLSRHLTRRAAELSGNFARLYAMNTVGAVAGTVAAGIVLIELFGLTATLAVGALGSGAAGVGAILLSRRTSDEPIERSLELRDEVDSPPSPTRNLGLLVAFISGLTSLGYQVLWTRLLSSGSGNSTYVFTIILAIFLVGIAIGAAVFVQRLAGSGRLLGAVGLAQLGVAALALLGLPFLARFIDVPFAIRVLIVVLPSTLVLGLTLPMASSLVGAAARRAGRDAGLLLGANTFGAICGTFVIPFVLIPAVGSPRSVALLALINAALGAALVGRDRLPIPRPAVVAAGLALVLTATGALGVQTPVVADPGLVGFRSGRVYAAAEDEIASVQAGEVGRGNKRLAVSGTAMTSLTVEARLMTHLPLMLRPESRNLLVIAFGMGSSWRSGLIAGLDTDGVELVPSVPDMLGYYHPDADSLRADPRGRIIIADGRNYVELTRREYDIIVVDPPPPIHSSGTAILYSREFYAAAGARLRPGGVMMEWMPGGQSVDEFRAHVRTFSASFPHVIIAFAATGKGTFMFGSTEPLGFDPVAIRGVLDRPGVLQDINDSMDEPITSVDDWAALIPTLPWLDTAGAQAFGGDGPLITDDRPLPEYFLLRRSFGELSPRATRPHLEDAMPGGG
jgi:spermidine synthase